MTVCSALAGIFSRAIWDEVLAHWIRKRAAPFVTYIILRWKRLLMKTEDFLSVRDEELRKS